MSQQTEKKTRGRPKDQEKAKAILTAAAKQFIEHGMTRTGMQDIADEANVSKYTVYNHFGTKEELFRHIIHNKCETNMSDNVLEIALKQSPKEGLFTLGMAFVGIIYNDEAIAMHRTIMSESRHDTGLAKLFYQAGPERVYYLMRVYLSHLEQEKVCKFDDVQRAVEVFLSFFTGPLHMRTVLKAAPKPNQAELEAFTRENVGYFMKIFEL